MSPQLQHLRINKVHGKVIPWAIVSMPVPSLLSLIIEHVSTDIVLALLSALSLKSLSTLELITVDFSSPRALPCFLDSSTDEPRFPELNSLTISHTLFPSKLPVAFFLSTPKVTHLTSIGRCTTMIICHIGEWAQFTPDEGPAWPHLGTFSVAEHVHLYRLQRALAARSAIGLPILHIRIHDPELDVALDTLRLRTGVERIDLLSCDDLEIMKSGSEHLFGPRT